MKTFLALAAMVFLAGQLTAQTTRAQLNNIRLANTVSTTPLVQHDKPMDVRVETIDRSAQQMLISQMEVLENRIAATRHSLTQGNSRKANAIDLAKLLGRRAQLAAQLEAVKRTQR